MFLLLGKHQQPQLKDLQDSQSRTRTHLRVGRAGDFCASCFPIRAVQQELTESGMGSDLCKYQLWKTLTSRHRWRAYYLPQSLTHSRDKVPSTHKLKERGLILAFRAERSQYRARRVQGNRDIGKVVMEESCLSHGSPEVESERQSQGLSQITAQ